MNMVYMSTLNTWSEQNKCAISGIEPASVNQGKHAVQTHA